jgi:hypothetical protein
MRGMMLRSVFVQRDRIGGGGRGLERWQSVLYWSLIDA